MDVHCRRSSCCSLLLLLLFGSRQKLKEFDPTPIQILSILEEKILYSQYRGYEFSRKNLDLRMFNVYVEFCRDCHR